MSSHDKGIQFHAHYFHMPMFGKADVCKLCSLFIGSSVHITTNAMRKVSDVGV